MRITLSLQEWILAGVMSIAVGLSAVMLSTGKYALSPMSLAIMLGLSLAAIMAIYMKGTGDPVWQARGRIVLGGAALVGLAWTFSVVAWRFYSTEFGMNAEEAILMSAQGLMLGSLFIPERKLEHPPID